MRILTWNVNVLRTCLDYHPFSSMKKRNVEGLLDELGAEIACFQEHKTRRTHLDKLTACPGPYDAFYTFPRSKTGYSGVCTYVDSRYCVPLRAEEGITGVLLDDKASTMRPPWTADERVGGYPDAQEMEWMDEDGGVAFDVKRLDMEGRAVVLDFGLFILFNLYCPNETNLSRRPYKMNFLHALQTRVRKLIAQGRQVIIAGDINIMRAPIDSGEGGIKTSAEQHYEHPARVLLDEWCSPKGEMIDVVRESWPGREGMYTCWNTKLDARPSNYGSRIDLILCSPGLRPWIKGGDILPKIHGSDHCPVFIDLHETIPNPDYPNDATRSLSLRDLLNPVDRPMSSAPSYPQDEDVPRTAPEPPRFATRFWDEFSGRQMTLKSFFGGGGGGGKVGGKGRERSSVNDYNGAKLEENNGGVGASNGRAVLAASAVSANEGAVSTPKSSAPSAPSPSSPPSTPFGIARAAFNELDRPGSSTRMSSTSVGVGGDGDSMIDLTGDDEGESERARGGEREREREGGFDGVQRGSPSRQRSVKSESQGQGASANTGGKSSSKIKMGRSKSGQQSIASFFAPPTTATVPPIGTADGRPRGVKRKSGSGVTARGEMDIGSRSGSGEEGLKGQAALSHHQSQHSHSHSHSHTRTTQRSATGTTSPPATDAFESTTATATATASTSTSTPASASTPDDASIAAAIAAADAERESARAAQKAEQAPIWGQLFARKLAPNCLVHNAPCRDYVSKVPGPNKGKRFWLCSLPVGAGYDTGRSKRRREDVNPEFRCDFFLWDSANSRKEPLPLPTS